MGRKIIESGVWLQEYRTRVEERWNVSLIPNNLEGSKTAAVLSPTFTEQPLKAIAVRGEVADFTSIR
jgi:hypothetical protein